MKYGLMFLLITAVLLSGCTVSLPWQSRQEVTAQEILSTATDEGFDLDAEDMYSAGFRLEQERMPGEAIVMYRTLLEQELVTREIFLRTWHRLFYAYGAIGDWPNAANSLVTLIGTDRDWTKLKIALDLVDQQNAASAISKYRSNVLPYINEPLHSEVEQWLTLMEQGVVYFALD